MKRKKEVRRYLRRTMEVSIMVRNTWVYMGAWILLALACFFNLRMWLPSVAIPGIIFVPYLIFFGIRYLRIMAKAESYCFYRAKLDMPHPSMRIRNRFYFTVALDEEDGTYTVVDTHAVFHAYGILWPAMENCLNQNVGIAYNPETKMVVVAG